MRYGFRRYVSVGTRQAKAARKMAKFEKQGIKISPIHPMGRKITATFWGNAWNDHIERFSDYDNRLPRGRTYVRNGSVCHLSIEAGLIEAYVAGSSVYNVSIEVTPLEKAKWQAIKKRCVGQIGSLLELLSGDLSDEIMELVCDDDQGLFPREEEISLTCSCPDWADMCKHIAAVLYGVGARLDVSPVKLFELRGVEPNELIDASSVIFEKDSGQSSRRRISDDTLTDIFDIDFDSDATELPVKQNSRQPTRGDERQSIGAEELKAPEKKKQSTLPRYFSGNSLQKKRLALGLSKAALARRLGVSPPTITNWEAKGKKKLKLREDVKAVLVELWD